MEALLFSTEMLQAAGVWITYSEAPFMRWCLNRLL